MRRYRRQFPNGPRPREVGRTANSSGLCQECALMCHSQSAPDKTLSLGWLMRFRHASRGFAQIRSKIVSLWIRLVGGAAPTCPGTASIERFSRILRSISSYLRFWSNGHLARSPLAQLMTSHFPLFADWTSFPPSLCLSIHAQVSLGLDGRTDGGILKTHFQHQ